MHNNILYICHPPLHIIIHHYFVAGSSSKSPLSTSLYTCTLLLLFIDVASFCNWCKSMFFVGFFFALVQHAQVFWYLPHFPEWSKCKKIFYLSYCTVNMSLSWSLCLSLAVFPIKLKWSSSIHFTQRHNHTSFLSPHHGTTTMSCFSAFPWTVWTL